MVLRLRGRDVLVIEVKLGAAMVPHVDPDASTTDEAGGASRSQLATHADWIAGQNAEAGDAWSGAVIMVTAWTAPPAGFHARAKTGVLEKCQLDTLRRRDALRAETAASARLSSYTTLC